MADNPNSAEHVTGKTRRPRWVRITAWIGFVVFLLFAAVFIFFAIYFHRAQPMLKQRVTQTLASRYDSRVELATFTVSVWRGFEVTGTGLKLYPNHLQMQQPLFAVKKFTFRTNWYDLLRSPMHVHLVRITGLDIHLPPKQQRANIPNPKGAKQSNGSQNAKMSIVVDRLVIDRASLVLGTDKPGKVPLDFEIGQIELHALGAGHAMRFHATLINPKPIGDIDSSGYFGPFSEHSPGDTPVKGTYKFSHADLNPLKGIGGILSSTGRYQGTLNNITVDGETDTPNFTLDTAGHPVPLHTKFHAIVDGTNGDTHLEPVDAMLLNSHIIARGDVVSVPGQGHDINLDVTVQPGHLEDILALAANAEPPVMTGDLTLHAKLSIPPGKQSVTRKMRLKGNFDVTNVHFTDPKVQDKIDQLSLRGQGKPEKAKQDAAHTINVNIASEMKGNFTLGNRRITITGLRYNVPGADIAMSGTYTLDSSQVDFHGTASLQAKLSQMVTGWKSLLLKPVSPFFSKNGAGTQVPISITGTRKDLHFGLDFFHDDDKDKKKDQK
ncbi:MAG: AsmA-like C-terminal region-containing protein [Acidobacteriaceae bacterium]